MLEISRIQQMREISRMHFEQIEVRLKRRIETLEGIVASKDAMLQEIARAADVDFGGAYSAPMLIHMLALKERAECAKLAKAYSELSSMDAGIVAGQEIAKAILSRTNYDKAPTNPHHGGKVTL